MERTTLQTLSSALWERDLHPGEYLTDGFRLYRVIVSRVFNEETLVELEDCRTLDVWLVRRDELNSLRPVRGPNAEPPDPRDRKSPHSPREPQWRWRL